MLLQSPCNVHGWKRDPFAEDVALRLLIVEDDATLGRWLCDTLALAVGAADLVRTLDEAEAAIAVRGFDLVVIDRRLPDGDGLDLLPGLRKRWPRAGALILTALDDPNDVARALDRGADDYLAKPFEPIELIARAKAVLRRLHLDNGGAVQIGNLSFDMADRSAKVNGAPLVISRRELALLEALVRRAGQVVLRETLESAVYGFEDEIQSNAIDAHISRLRTRLRENKCLATIRPVRGLGYLLSSAE